MKKLPWIMAAMWLVSRVIASKFMSIEYAKNFGVLSNVLLILILIFVTVFYKYKAKGQDTPSFLEDLKDCMKTAMKYVIGAVAGIALFYGILSNDVQSIRESRIQLFNTEVQDDANYEKLKSEHVELKDMTKEQLMQTNKENVERYVSVHMQIIGGLLALTFVSFAYSLLAVLLWRGFMLRNGNLRG